MRKSDREVIRKSGLAAIIDNCDVCRVAFFDDAHPYIVPMNFGCDYSGDLPVLYFHCATEGRKLDLLRRNPNVCFEIGRMIKITSAGTVCKWSSEFESVIGEGKIEIVGDPEERLVGMNAIMRKCGGGEGSHSFDSNVMGKVAVLKIRVEGMTGKRLVK